MLLLMEHRAETTHSGATENGKKTSSSKLFDLQNVYNTKRTLESERKGGSQQSSGSNSALNKRKLGSEEGQKQVRKKSKKEVLLSSLSSGGRKGSKKSSGEVGKVLPISSASTESRTDRRVNGIGGLGGISHNLSAIINIPKRPRDLIGRKKAGLVDLRTKQDETSSSKASLDEAGGKLNGNLLGEGLLQNGNVDAKLDGNGESEGVLKRGVVAAKVKQKKDPNDLVEHSSNGSDSHRKLKRADSHLSAHNGCASKKKPKRDDKTTKQTKTKKAKETKPTLEESSWICDSSHDEEENLEENAARMLSSRFDTSCTGYSSSGGKSSKLPATNGLSGLSSSTGDVPAHQPNSGVESEVVSSDAEVRVLRPRDQLKGKRILRRRRHFYEVFSREMDSYWALNRRIKVFWPLDQTWYVGHVIAYDLNKKLHHIKYDDREEEWVDLGNERFKLLLLPSEVPRKGRNRKSRMHVNRARKEKHDQATEKESNSNSYMESEPIISWLPQSRQKSPSFQTRKKQKIINTSAKSSFSDGKNDPQGNLQVPSSGRNADDLVCSSALPENQADSLSNRNPLTEKAKSHYCKPPIVYFRRRFRRREQQQCDIRGEELCELSNNAPLCGKGNDFFDSFDLVTDMLQSMVEYSHMVTRLSPDEFIWNTDDSGALKLTAPVTNIKVFLKLCFAIPVSIHNIYGGDCYLHLHRHGSLISVWPMVHLEMLFIDNTVGLRFLLYEGCLKNAVLLAFLVLDVFHQSNQNVLHIDEQLPVTSVRFKFTGLQVLQKQLVFAFYHFRELSNSKWSYLDRKLKKHCLLTKQVPPSECTYDNIKALQNGCNVLPLTHEPGSLKNSRKRSRLKRKSIASRQSTRVRLSRQSSDIDGTLGKVPSFAFSFAAAPTFFLSLHLKLLMERSIPPSNFGELDPITLIDLPDNIGLVRADSFAVQNHAPSVGGDMKVLSRVESKLESSPNRALGVGVLDLASDPSLSLETDANIQQEIGKAQPKDPRSCLYVQSLDSGDQPVETRVECSSSSGMAVEIPSADHNERDVDGRVQNTPRPIILALDVSNCAVYSPDSNSSHSIWNQSRAGGSRSLALGKQDILRNGFGNGPKKPRTQVSYSLSFGGHDSNSKTKFHHSRGFPHKRIRRASEKKAPEPLSMPQKNAELLSCDVNVLITAADRGCRECGAKVVLELDHHEWRLVVKISGNTKYSYKAHQFLQPGTTNRYTHVMMWKGGKDWILEFPDRSQWAIFKEMHEECYNRNFRAASVKNIPIPGVRLVEEADDNVPEVPFTRSCNKYYRQLETDVDIATDPGRVVYDMDSDDEQWIATNKATTTNLSGCEEISYEMFEKTMDVFEKVAFTKQRDHLSSDDLEDLSEFGPMEAIKIIHEYWRERRLRKGMPLIRHLQPPLWENYQQQVKEWEQASSAGLENLITSEKPSMFAFCLKPRGLEMPNRGSKQRSQKRLPVGSLGGVISGDQDAFHLVGRRLNGYAFGDAYNQGTSDSSPVLQGSGRVYSPRDAGSMGYFSLSSDGEKTHYPKLYRNKSKKLCFISPPSYDQQSFASCSQRITSKKFASGWNGSSSEWHSPTDHHHQADGFQRQLDPSELDEFRLRDAASAARHAVTIAKMKRETAQRMLCRADLAMHKAVVAIMTAEAIEASYKDTDNNDG